MIPDLFVLAGVGLSLLSYGDSGEGSANESYQKRLREFIERQREELNCWEEKLLLEPPVADRTQTVLQTLQRRFDNFGWTGGLTDQRRDQLVGLRPRKVISLLKTSLWSAVQRLVLLRAVERIIISFSASAAKSVRGARIINSGAAGPGSCNQHPSQSTGP